MRRRRFGKHPVSVSEIGFGAWAIGGGWGPQNDEDSVAALERAIELGIDFVDTAAGYGNGKSERLIGAFLRERPKLRYVLVATKIPPVSGTWPPSPFDDASERYSKSYLGDSLQQSMENLQVSTVDLVQLHTWTRAWNRDPQPFETLRHLQQEGKIGLIGVSTPEHDQNAVIDLMKGGWVDSVQVIYNLFEQEPAAELLDIAGETGTGVIVRVALDEGSLTGKFNGQTHFKEGDFRENYFAGDRLARTLARVAEIERDLEGSSYTLLEAAIKFPLSHPAVSTVILGMRNVAQVESNCRAAELSPLPASLLQKLHRHNWRKGVWYGGK